MAQKNAPSMLTPPGDLNGIPLIYTQAPMLNVAADTQKIISTLGSSNLDDPKRHRVQKSPKKFTLKNIRNLVSRGVQAFREKKDKVSSSLKSKQTINPPEPNVRRVETDLLLTKLNNVFDLICSDEQYFNAFNYYSEYMPGLSTSSMPAGSRGLPTDYFINLTDEPTIVKNPPPVGTPREPGQFFAGEEKQWEQAVRDFYQSIIDRFFELYKALQVAVRENETWITWAASFITRPFIFLGDTAIQLIVILQAALDELCTGNSKQDTCQIRAHEVDVEKNVEPTTMGINLNEYWNEHCTPGADESFVGSLLCDFGNGSKMANLILRIKPIALPPTIRDKRYDIVQILLNIVLKMLVTGKEYQQLMIDDVNALQPPLSEAEKREILTLEARRDVANDEQSLKKRLVDKAFEKVAGITKEKIFEIKRMRNKGAVYSIKDLDFLAEFLEKYVFPIDALRKVLNNSLVYYGIEFPKYKPKN